jgi:rhamnulose-1-phosphate aldolase/alcohol dehydrogenase
MTSHSAKELLNRSHRLGQNPQNTNYAGGNTSAKGTVKDPVTGGTVEVMWVKGSGGDLGTLTEEGLSTLRLDRFLALAGVYPGVQGEDEMVELLEYCLHGRGGATPSIDTAMHGLVDVPHVDHLHPDSGIAIATSIDGEKLTKKIFGGTVAWVPWRRPGFQLGLDIQKIQAENPTAIGCILGGHGITAWGKTSAECEANSLKIIAECEKYIKQHGKKNPLGKKIPAHKPLSAKGRHARAAALAPAIRAMASTEKVQVGHFVDDPIVLEFLEHEKHSTLVPLGTSCPDHFLRTKVKPLLLDLPPSAPVEQAIERLQKLHEEYREEYQGYYKKHASKDSPAMRGADPAIVLVPGVGMFSFGANKQTARVAGEFYINAINVMRAAEGISKYQPINDAEKFRIEYWSLEEAKLQRMPKPKPLQGRIALVTGAASGIGKAIAIRLAQEGACVAVVDLDLKKAQATAKELGGPDVAVGLKADVSNKAEVEAAVHDTVVAFGGLDLVVNNAGLSKSGSLLETTVADWDLQHDVMSKGSFLVSQAAAKVLIGQKLGGDIVYISSKNSIFVGPNNIAYSAAKADQAHQVRLLAAELGEYGVRVNGINPDGVVQGSGIFSGGWGAARAAYYGVPEAELGKYYANRTLLKLEVLPENVANAVFAVCAGDLTHTTGLHIPVDGGVAAAFLR